MVVVSLATITGTASLPAALDHVPAWVGWIAAALFCPFIWMFVKKLIVSYVVKALTNGVEDILAAGDEDDDRLTIHFVHWVERKADKLQAGGFQRYAAVARWVCSKFPPLKGREDAVLDLIQSLVEGVEDAAKRIEAKNPETPESCPTPPPPAV